MPLTPDEKEVIDSIHESNSQSTYKQLQVLVSKELGYEVKVRQIYDYIRRRGDSEIDKQKTRQEIKSDGSILRVARIALTEDELQSPESIMKKHGFDPHQWEVVSCINNFWQQQKKGGKLLDLYQSKINVKPRSANFTDIIEEIKQATVPLDIPKNTKIQSETRLLININDTHFGPNTYEDYKDRQNIIIDNIRKGHKEIVIAFLGDLFEHDNFRGTTAHGTFTGETDMVQAWKDLVKYVEPIIVNSIMNCTEMKLIYIRGNHSESMEWAFIQYLKARFKNIDIDDSLKFHKAVLIGNTFVGLSHGQYNPKNLAINMAKQYSKLWALADTHMIVSAHQHKYVEIPGALLYVLPSAAVSNSWAEEHNFGYQMQKFLHFVFNDEGLYGTFYS